MKWWNIESASENKQWRFCVTLSRLSLPTWIHSMSVISPWRQQQVQDSAQTVWAESAPWRCSRPAPFWRSGCRRWRCSTGARGLCPVSGSEEHCCVGTPWLSWWSWTPHSSMHAWFGFDLLLQASTSTYNVKESPKRNEENTMHCSLYTPQNDKVCCLARQNTPQLCLWYCKSKCYC